MKDMIEHPNIKLNLSLTPKTDANVFLNIGVSPLPVEHNGPFVRNKENQLLCINDKTVFLSHNDGKNWQEIELFSEKQDFSITRSHSIICTEDGTIIVSFINFAKKHFKWRKKANAPTKNTFIHHYAVRSEDGGLTWQEPILIQKGYAATTTTIIQLKSGAILLSTQNLDYKEARHFSLSFRSEDNGKSWQASNKLDIGGRGHHDGCYEGTLVELHNRVWFCIRTNLDYFWNAYSYDDGKNWTEIKPGIEASSSPAMLSRLTSGRLIMIYNPLYPAGESRYARQSGQFSVCEASWHREQLAGIISEDDGQTWSKPFILAHCDNAWLSYPYVFEARPGEIWVTTMQSQLKIQCNESILLEKF